jgi:hypothetical protein
VAQKVLELELTNFYRNVDQHVKLFTWGSLLDLFSFVRVIDLDLV